MVPSTPIGAEGARGVRTGLRESDAAGELGIHEHEPVVGGLELPGEPFVEPREENRTTAPAAVVRMCS